MNSKNELLKNHCAIIEHIIPNGFILYFHIRFSFFDFSLSLFIMKIKHTFMTKHSSWGSKISNVIGHFTFWLTTKWHFSKCGHVCCNVEYIYKWMRSLMKKWYPSFFSGSVFYFNLSINGRIINTVELLNEKKALFFSCSTLQTSFWFEIDQ